MIRYPVYIISKGRADTCFTADFFLRDKVDFKIVVEPQEAKLYQDNYGMDAVLILPFSNLGLGGMPARNWVWEHSIELGAERHWIFDDNIREIRRLHKGKRIRCNANIGIGAVEDFTDRYTNVGISGFNYMMFVMNTAKKPYQVNCHVYSAILLNNSLKHRWRLKYNEDVDLCLQILHDKYCSILFNAFMVAKVSTTAKMKGGNQTELYKNNAFEKKVLKARSLEEVWPQYAETVMRYNRPHHYVNWKKHFKHKLIRRSDIDWEAIKEKKHKIGLTKLNDIRSKDLQKLYNEEKK